MNEYTLYYFGYYCTKFQRWMLTFLLVPQIIVCAIVWYYRADCDFYIALSWVAFAVLYFIFHLGRRALVMAIRDQYIPPADEE